LIRAAIIDDHPLARFGLTRILAASGRVAVVATAASAAGLASQFDLADAADAPDVVICDLYHTDDGPCFGDVAALAASVPTLVFSASDRLADVLGAIAVGASGYVTKRASPAMIVAAVETVAAGGFALSPQLAEVVCARPLGRRAIPGGLSPREGQALALIAAGFTHAQVAVRMGVTRATVETYVERIRTKLQLGNKADLTRAAFARSARPPS